VPRTKVARLDIVGKQVQDKKLADAETERKLQEEKDALAKAEQERLQKEKDAVLALAEQEKKQAEKLALDAEAAVRKQKEREDADAAARRQKEKDDAEAARKRKEREDAEAARKAKEKEEAARKERERQRKEQEDRIAKMAKELDMKDQTGEQKRRIEKMKSENLEVTAVDSGNKLVTEISDKYAASIQAAIRPNITFDADSVSGNPAVEIHVGLRPDGTIFNATIVKTSGVRSWDTAAARALGKTERLPKEENGRTPSTLLITLRPRER
jgi:colicin import membrane protein